MIFGKIEGIDNVGRLLRKIIPDEIVKGLAQTIRKEAKEILADARSAAPVATGKLQSELKITTKNKGLDAAIGLTHSFARGYIARFLTFGTKPHIILPRKGQFLRLLSGLYVKMIHHPGIKPHDFLLFRSYPERKRFQEKIRQTLIEVLRRYNNS